MYAKSTRPSVKREVQKERSAKRDDRIACPSRAQTCARSALRECAREAGRFFVINLPSFESSKKGTVAKLKVKRYEVYLKPEMELILIINFIISINLFSE